LLFLVLIRLYSVVSTDIGADVGVAATNVRTTVGCTAASVVIIATAVDGLSTTGNRFKVGITEFTTD
jgi:hypothetical protein